MPLLRVSVAPGRSDLASPPHAENSVGWPRTVHARSHPVKRRLLTTIQSSFEAHRDPATSTGKADRKTTAFEEAPCTTWRVQPSQDWAAVALLNKVCALSSDLSFSSANPGLLNPALKLLYEIELFLQLGWRLIQPGSTSCLLTVQAHNDDELQPLVGVLEVSVQDSTSLAEASWRPWGPQILFLTTMAVKRVKRKQGIATALLRAAEDWSLAAHSDVSHAALLVYRNNDAATRLYCRHGYEKATWTDPEWLNSAEKGQLGPTKRFLYTKRIGAIAEPE